MQLYKYETHSHTSETSNCSQISAKDLIAYYKKQGHAGIIITDHFLNGNNTVPPDLSWGERVNLFSVGYEKALEEGSKVGIDVFYGWEYSYRGSDFITYGLDEKWLLDHPDILDYSLNDYLDLVHKDGGFIIHAHPFREADYIDMIRLLPRKVDAVEVLNSGRTDFENERANDYADIYNLPKCAGTDIHRSTIKRVCGIALKQKANTIFDIIDAIKSGEASIFEDKPK